jgi:uncharacterized membrane protein
MLLTASQPWEQILFLILAMVLLIIFVFLAVWAVGSKLQAKKRKAGIIFLGILGVLLYIFVTAGWNALIGTFSGKIDGWPYGTYLENLGPIFIFVIFIVLTRWLVDVDWVKSVDVALLSLLFLALFLTFVPYVGQYLPIFA